MKFCSKCGQELQDDMEFCPKCGTKQVIQTEKPAEPTNPFQAGGFNRASNANRRNDNVNNNNNNIAPSTPMQETITIQDIENDLGPKFILCGILNMVLSVLGFVISAIIMVTSSGKSRQYIKEHGIKNIKFSQYSSSFKMKYMFYMLGLIIGIIWPMIIVLVTL